MAPNSTHEFKEGFMEEVVFKHKGSVEIRQESWVLEEVSQRHIGKRSNMSKNPRQNPA